MKYILFISAVLLSFALSGQLSSENFDIKVIKGNRNFTSRWDDSGSGADKDVSIWRPRVPSGYYFLGDVVLSEHAPNGISKLYALVIKPKKGGLIQRASRGEVVWDDSGSGADRDLRKLMLN